MYGNFRVVCYTSIEKILPAKFVYAPGYHITEGEATNIATALHAYDKDIITVIEFLPEGERDYREW